MTWEERWHPLREEWVVVSDHRDDRPWLGERVATASEKLQPYVEDCTFCPRNLRVSGERNPDYRGVFVFDNDVPCVGPEAPTDIHAPPGILENRRATGLSRIVCYTPRHDLTLAELDLGDIDALLACWQEQYEDLGARPDVVCVHAFENKGAVMGVSNPHPHGQIYATNFPFKTIEIEAAAATKHHAATGRVLFSDILAAEVDDGRRILVDRDSATSFVPYFARYPYETYVTPVETHASIAGLSSEERGDLAAVLKETLVRMDNLWKMSFPYVLALHQAPTDGREHPGFHFHIQIHPPLRRPGLLKYLAGPEIGGGCFLNDTAPEDKAAELRAVPSVHYKEERGS